MIELDTITIEGPDLAGKTTLYNQLHRKTGYKWNIQDRSVLSMLCYSIFYNRGDDDICLLYTSPSPRDKRQSRMPSSA